MLRVLTDYHDFTFSLDDLALIADLLYGWFNFHCTTIPFFYMVLLVFYESPNGVFAVSFKFILFCSPCDAAFIKVVNGNLYGYLITGQNSDIVHSKLS